MTDILPARTVLSGAVDFAMMYAAHDAFARHLDRLVTRLEHSGRVTPPAFEQWREFDSQLHTHHTGEDLALWPALRAAAPDEHQATLDAMDAEHAGLDPHLERIDSQIADAHATAAAASIHGLSAALGAHMRHEENEALPLIEAYLGPAGWAGFGQHMRSSIGRKGAQTYFPWLLDGADEQTTRHILALLPLPARILYRRSWLPKYRRCGEGGRRHPNGRGGANGQPRNS
ncbi:MAG: hemerythrin domain-containing protein [Pseudonocardiales bacterium]